MTHPAAPIGALPEDNKVIKTWGESTKFDFKPKDHVAVAEALDLVDFEAGSAVAGQKFYFLKNDAVLLELALIQYAMTTLLKHGYTPIITPDLARVDVRTRHDHGLRGRSHRFSLGHCLLQGHDGNDTRHDGQ